MRYKKVTRVSRRYSPSPPRTARMSRTHVIEELRQSSPAPPSSPPPAPRAPTIIAPPSVRAETVVSRRTSRAPPTARAPSVRSTTRSHYVEVEEESASSVSSSDHDDVRSWTTAHTRKSSRSKTAAKAETEYSFHEREREVRREKVPSRPEFETYRYVNAPPDARRRSGSRTGNLDQSVSREEYRRVRERVVVDDDGRSRR